MAEKIGGYNRPGTDTRLNRTQTTEQPARGRTADASAARAPAKDSIELTDTVARLRTIESRLRELPDVDQRRVEALRQRIDSGEYEIDPRAIAESLLEFERKLY